MAENRSDGLPEQIRSWVNSFKKLVCDALRSFSIYERFVAAAFAVVFLLFALMLWEIGKPELVPASFGAIATAMFALLAFRFSKEKFRLDLSQQRWAIYENLVTFLSLAVQTGLKSKQATDAAEGSFRGIGLHRSRALFGPDIGELLNKLNESYGWLLSHETAPNGDSQRNEWADKTTKHEDFVWKTVNELPNHFRPYLYFGDYKR